MGLAIEGASTIGDHLAGLRQTRPRIFWVGLGLALLVHVLAIVGINIAKPRSVGSPDGAQDAIAVEIVDGATLRDSMERPSPASSPPGSPQPVATPAEKPAQPPPEPEAQPQPEPPAPPEVAALQPTPEPTPAPPESPPAQKEPQKLAAPELPALEDAPTAEEPKPEIAPEAPKPQQQPKQAQQKQAKQPPKKKTAALDLSVPFDSGPASSDSGSSSAVQRPPGITRSGENDQFARNVIRALQKTMPRERNAIGRVTVRIVLTQDGSRADVKLLQSGGNADLDFNVMFAARQTAYPFPPNNSTLVDRTFTVTYIYR
jgi:periplasmic protein TonB